MCKYCEIGKPIRYCSNYYEYEYTKYNYSYNRFENFNQLHKIDVPANYCPACGKKLEE